MLSAPILYKTLVATPISKNQTFLLLPVSICYRCYLCVWTLASEIRGHDIREHFADRTVQDGICNNICEDRSEFYFDKKVQIAEVQTDDEGFFGSIVSIPEANLDA